jgi:hypothetical protein
MILIYFANETISKIETPDSFPSRTQGLSFATGLWLFWRLSEKKKRPFREKETLRPLYGFGRRT